jgi:Protein of Unknown function (DUF2784)
MNMPAWAFEAAADVLVVCHLTFVIFVVLGGLLVLRWRRVAWLHLPAAAWGAAIEFGGWVCPLTRVENALRQHAGLAAYRGDFIAHEILPVLYPADLTRGLQILLGMFALAVNLVVYWWVLRTVRRPR